jgi:beta-xylosidase
MKDDMSGLAETPRQIRPDKADQVGFEGAFLFKANGRYYLSCADFVGPKDDPQYHCFVAQADRLEGPWSERYLAVPSGGHNMFFQAQDGSWYSTVFGNDSHAPFKERPGIVPIAFDATGKVAPK